MVSYYTFRSTKRKLVSRHNHQPNLIEELINEDGEIQITEPPFHHIERLQIK